MAEEPRSRTTLPVTITVTYDSREGTYSFAPASQQVLRGSTVTLIADGASSIPVVARLSSDDTDYEPLGTPPYEAIESPGNEFMLGEREMSTGYLTVDKETVTQTGTIIPVGTMEISSGGFTPEDITVEQGGLLLLTWLGGGDQVQIKTYDTEDQPYSLFGGTGNSYWISDEGTTLTVPLTVPEAEGYAIEFDSTTRAPGDPEVPVRGTVNVTVRK